MNEHEGKWALLTEIRRWGSTPEDGMRVYKLGTAADMHLRGAYLQAVLIDDSVD